MAEKMYEVIQDIGQGKTYFFYSYSLRVIWQSLESKKAQ
jgi:hypothetical protein